MTTDTPQVRLQTALILLIDGDRYRLRIEAPGPFQSRRFSLQKEGSDRVYEVVESLGMGRRCDCTSWQYRHRNKRHPGQCRHVAALAAEGLFS
jgi:hypothetical protein